MASHKILKYSYWLSLLCLVHCISFPIAIAFLPIFDIAFDLGIKAELAILLSVFILGSYALWHAFIKHHKNYLPLIIFYIGIALSVYIHFIYQNPFGDHHHTHNHSWGVVAIEVFSGILIALAQFYNLKITPKSCSHKH